MQHPLRVCHVGAPTSGCILQAHINLAGHGNPCRPRVQRLPAAAAAPAAAPPRHPAAEGRPHERDPPQVVPCSCIPLTTTCVYAHAHSTPCSHSRTREGATRSLKCRTSPCGDHASHTSARAPSVRADVLREGRKGSDRAFGCRDCRPVRVDADGTCSCQGSVVVGRRAGGIRWRSGGWWVVAAVDAPYTCGAMYWSTLTELSMWVVGRICRAIAARPSSVKQKSAFRTSHLPSPKRFASVSAASVSFSSASVSSGSCVIR